MTYNVFGGTLILAQSISRRNRIYFCILFAVLNTLTAYLVNAHNFQMGE